MTALPRPHLPPFTQALAIAPPPARHLDSGQALRRLRHYAGRTLTQSALDIEQTYRDGRFALIGRRLSPGVITGLTLSIQDAAAVPSVLVLQSGAGLAASGQDVLVRRAAQVNVNALRVLDSEDDAAITPSGLGVIVLQPITRDEEVFASEADREAAFRDPCPLDRDALAFRSFERRDAARLLFVPLPADLAASAGPRRRNEIANAIYAREQAQGTNALPWTAPGVPLALVEVAPDGRVLFVDLAAVARKGGIPKPRSLPASGPSVFLRQARLEGLLIHLTELANDPDWSGRASDHLRFLPPSGILPRRAWEEGLFFPPIWRQAMAPIPIEQLDAALEESAALAPFDLDAAEEVLWLVPVPASVYEPELLVTPHPDPIFAATLASLGTAVRGRLNRRTALRGMAAVVQGTIDPALVTAFAADTDAVPGEAVFPPPAQPDPVKDWSPLTLDKLRVLFDSAPRTLLPAEDIAAIDPAQRTGLRPLVGRLGQRVQSANDKIDLGFTRLQTDIYRVRQLMLEEAEATKLATSPVLAGIAKGSNGFAASAALSAHFLASKKPTPPPAPPPATSGSTRTRMLVETSLAGRDRLLSSTSMSLVSARPISGSSPALAAPSAAFATSVPFAGATSITGPALQFSLQPLLEQAGATRGAQAQTNAFSQIMSDVRASAVDDLVLTSTSSKRRGIQLAAAIPGAFSDFRTLTIADRLKASPAPEARSSAVRTKSEIISQVQALSIPLNGLTVPLATRASGLNLVTRDTLDRHRAGLNVDLQARLNPRVTELAGTETAGERTRLVVVRVGGPPDALLADVLSRLAQPDAILGHTNLWRAILSGVLDPEPPDGDESAFLEVAVGALETAVAVLRAVEGRIATLQGFLDSAQDTLADLLDLLSGWNEELAAADRDLAEARHDWRVADALRAEEEERVEALRLRRLGIIRDHVRFVAYVRPRHSSLDESRTMQSRPLANVEADPVIEALAEDADPPDELEELLGVLRSVPVAWIRPAAALVQQFDRPERLDQVYAGYGLRAQSKLLIAHERRAPEATSGSRGTALRVVTAYREITQQFQVARLAIDVAAAATLSWRERQRRAQLELSLDDLIESRAKTQVGRRAHEIIENIERVATALFQHIQRVNGAVRLSWVQRISEFDTRIDMRDLSRLPGWPSLPADQRHEIARLAGWLFTQIDNDEAQAVALMGDIVRVAILLASHAPVAEIVAGQVRTAQTAQVGGVVDVELNRGRPRVGMKVGIYSAGVLAVQGVVRDLAGGKARIEVTSARDKVVHIDTTAQVYLHAATARALVRG